MNRIRKLVYHLGFRPIFGSIFFSPTLSVHYDWEDYWKRNQKK